MRMVRPAFLQDVEQRVRNAGTLLIADEVLTGFGRCGEFLATQRAGIQPDLVALSKGLTAGFLPMGITMANGMVFDAFIGDNPTLTLWHGHSFTANPLGCAAAKKPRGHQGKIPGDRADLFAGLPFGKPI